jgi:hypothetical protein
VTGIFTPAEVIGFGEVGRAISPMSALAHLGAHGLWPVGLVGGG